MSTASSCSITPSISIPTSPDSIPPRCLISTRAKTEKEAEAAALATLLSKDPKILEKERKLPKQIGGDLVSFITSRVHPSHIPNLYQFLGEPKGYTLIAPSLDQRANDPPLGYIIVFLDQFRNGLRFPLPPIYHAIYQELGIPLSQITPLSIKFITCFLVLVKAHGGKPCLSDFLNFYQAKKHAPHFFYFSSVPHGFIGGKDKAKMDWKNYFIFVTPPTNETWSFPSAWISTESISLVRLEIPPILEVDVTNQFKSKKFYPEVLIEEKTLSYLGLSLHAKDDNFDLGATMLRAMIKAVDKQAKAENITVPTSPSHSQNPKISKRPTNPPKMTRQK